MPKGGFRPGAGRPKGAKNQKLPMPDVCTAAQQANLTPLEYMLKVLNDPSVEPERRDRIAIAAAPYIHPKAGQGSKKDEVLEEAKKAAQKLAPANLPGLKVVKKCEKND